MSWEAEGLWPRIMKKWKKTSPSLQVEGHLLYSYLPIQRNLSSLWRKKTSLTAFTLFNTLWPAFNWNCPKTKLNDWKQKKKQTIERGPQILKFSDKDFKIPRTLQGPDAPHHACGWQYCTVHLETGGRVNLLCVCCHQKKKRIKIQSQALGIKNTIAELKTQKKGWKIWGNLPTLLLSF